MRRAWTISSRASRAETAAVGARPVVALGVLGAGMVVPAVYLAQRYPLEPNARELTDLGKLSSYTHASFWVFVGALVAWFVMYAAGIVVARRCEQRVALAIVVASAAIAGLFLVTMYPVNAIDMQMYAARSRLFTEHGVDPIAVAPVDFPGDPWMALVSAEWSGRTSPYGPLWTLVAAPITLLAGDDLLRALLGFKLLALNCYLATGWLIARALPDERPAVAALVFLWNPLVLWEAVGNGHNDAVVALLLVAAMAAFIRGRLVWVLPALVAATLLKYVSVVLLPLALVAVVRRAGQAGTLSRTLARAALVSAAVVVIGLAPFYDLAAIRASVSSQGGIYATSPAAVAIRALRDHLDASTGVRVAEAVGVIALGATALIWLRRLRDQPARLPGASFEVIFVFLLLATLNFRGWYLIWLVALAATSSSGWAAGRAAAWSAGAMAAYPLLIWVWGWEGYSFERVERIAVALMFVPPLVVTLAQVIASRARPRRWIARLAGLSPSYSDDAAS